MRTITRHSTRPGMRGVVAAAATAGLLLTVSACADGASAEAAADAETAAATVLVERARPTLTTGERDGRTINVEDTEVPREAVEVPFQPTAVIPFDISALDTIHTIGAGDAVVAIPGGVRLPDYLSEYADLPEVGTMQEPDLEAIAELDVDLIITGARTTGQYDALSEIATTIDLSGAAGGKFEPTVALERAAQIGEIFGKEDAVAEHAAAINAAVDELANQTEDAGTALVLQVTGGEYGAYAEGSRFGFFFDTLGLTPAVPQADLPGGAEHGEAVSNEFLYQANPDWLLVFDRGAATGQSNEAAQEVLDNELVNRTTAATAGHVVFLSPTELYIVTNGLTAIQTVLDEVAAAFSA